MVGVEINPDRLRLVLHVRRKKVARLAREADVYSSQIYRILHGESTRLKAEALYKIAAALDVSAAFLRGEDCPSGIDRDTLRYKITALKAQIAKADAQSDDVQRLRAELEKAQELYMRLEIRPEG